MINKNGNSTCNNKGKEAISFNKFLEEIFGDFKIRSLPFPIEEFQKNTLVNQNMDYYIEKDGTHVVQIASSLQPEDISIEVVDNHLIIVGNKQYGETIENQDRKYIYESNRTKSFKQKIKLSNEIDYNSINAKYEHGILEINFKEKEKNNKKIDIKF